METIQVSSSAFDQGANIPVKYTCDAQNVSPPLRWSGTPQGTQSIALIADDPDAPRGTFTHWIAFNIDASRSELPEGTGQTAGGPAGTLGENSFGNLGYGGPCPPRGSSHRYFFKLYALDSQLDLEQGANKAKVEQAMQGHILGQGQLMGKYTRK